MTNAAVRAARENLDVMVTERRARLHLVRLRVIDECVERCIGKCAK